MFRTSYHTALTKITYGGKGLSSGGINDEVVLFDSGSSYTYFPKRAYNELVAEVSCMKIDSCKLAFCMLL